MNCKIHFDVNCRYCGFLRAYGSGFIRVATQYSILPQVNILPKSLRNYTVLSRLFYAVHCTRCDTFHLYYDHTETDLEIGNLAWLQIDFQKATLHDEVICIQHYSHDWQYTINNTLSEAIGLLPLSEVIAQSTDYHHLIQIGAYLTQYWLFPRTGKPRENRFYQLHSQLTPLYIII